MTSRAGYGRTTALVNQEEKPSTSLTCKARPLVIVIHIMRPAHSTSVSKIQTVQIGQGYWMVVECVLFVPQMAAHESW